jgi:hypothetical protein
MTDLLTALSAIATTEAIRLLNGKQFPFTQETGAVQFNGVVQAVDPAQHLQIDVQQFNLGADSLSTQIDLRCRLEITGRITQASGTIDVAATADAAMAVAASAKLLMEGIDFMVDPDVQDLDVSLEIMEMTPDNLSGGKQLISSFANKAFQSRKASILETLNESLVPRKLEL